MSSRFAIRHQDVTHERLDGEVIAVNLLTGRYYSMTGSAADCWTAIAMTGSVVASAELLAATYGAEVELESDVADFVSACIEAGLIEKSAAESLGEAAGPLPSDFQRTQWLPPRLDEYEDLQDLILVDPVHDTSALGWPHVEDPGT